MDHIQALIDETFATSKNSSLTLDIFCVAAAADLLALSAKGQRFAVATTN